MNWLRKKNLTMHNPIVETNIFSFLQRIGIVIHFESIHEKTFLPGLQIKNGTIIVDREKWLYLGDIVHEAGHIAVVPANERNDLHEENIGSRKDQAAEEMMAIAWSYAVCIFLQIDPHIVFHVEGYKSGGASIVENFNQGRTFGVPMLQFTHMCIDPASPLRQEGDKCYPEMLQWLRD
jgi:antirestriction protein ArdC